MKKFIKTGVALTAAAMLLSGCGDGLLVMNEAEEAIVVSYSAGALAKRNVYQPEGLTAVYEGEDDGEEDPVDTPTEPKESQEEPADGMEEDPVDTIEPEDGMDTEDAGAEGEASGAGDDASKAPETSDLAGALGLSGIRMSYTDYSVNGSYQQGDYYSLDANPGNTFVILNFNVTNNTAEDIQCDILSKQPIFTLEINGGTGVHNEVTVLANDLSTYHEAIGAGKTEAAILLFEVPEDVAGNISSLQLSVQADGGSNRLAIE